MFALDVPMLLASTKKNVIIITHFKSYLFSCKLNSPKANYRVSTNTKNNSSKTRQDKTIKKQTKKQTKNKSKKDG
jgi:hypothetical protein